MHLVCLLASVIRCPRRLEYFKILLDSVRSQTSRLDGFFISIHIAPELEQGINYSELFKGLPNVRILKQKRAKPQFAQYQELYTRLGEAFPCPSDKEGFLLFSDDDDVWHEHRVEMYRTQWERACAMPGAPINRVSSICMRERIKVCNRFCTKHTDTSNVQSYLDCGCLVFEQIPDIHVSLEFHEYAVRRHVMGEFFQQHGDFCLYNRFADIVFRDFIFSYKLDEGITLHMCPPSWMYFYRLGDSNYLAQTRPVAHPERVESFSNHPENIKIMIHYCLDQLECKSLKDMGQSALKSIHSFTSREEMRRLMSQVLEERKVRIYDKRPR